jgi:hypothetical protein
MNKKDKERNKYLKRIAQFREELAEKVWFVLTKDGVAVKIERRDDPEKYCVLPAHESIKDQPETRYKIARVTGLAMPPMEYVDYNQFIWKMFRIGSDVASARKEVAALHDKINELHMNMCKPQ